VSEARFARHDHAKLDRPNKLESITTPAFQRSLEALQGIDPDDLRFGFSGVPISMFQMRLEKECVALADGDLIASDIELNLSGKNKSHLFSLVLNQTLRRVAVRRYQLHLAASSVVVLTIN
jgi:hypothetical protein